MFYRDLKGRNYFTRWLMILLLLLSLTAALVPAAFGAGDDGSGGHVGSKEGEPPPDLTGAYLTTISDNTSTTGDSIADSAGVPVKPVIKLTFTNNAVGYSYDKLWDNNQGCFSMQDGAGKTVAITVSRIPRDVNPNERRNVFITPAGSFSPGETYKIIVSPKLMFNDGRILNKEVTVTFKVTSAGSAAGTAAGTASTGSFSDIAGHWARSNIEKLAALGAVKGYPGGGFKPEDTITRAEFAVILVKAFKLEPKSGKVFTDTAGHWARDSVATAEGYGIVNGYEEGNFGPDDLITREQMAVLVVKTAKLEQVDGETKFADSAGISDWARAAIATAVKNGIMKGYPDNTFQPQGNTTRAEAVTVIMNALILPR